MAENEKFSDEEILNLLKTGDPRAPSLLFTAHYLAVYNNAKKYPLLLSLPTNELVQVLCDGF